MRSLVPVVLVLAASAAACVMWWNHWVPECGFILFASGPAAWLWDRERYLCEFMVDSLALGIVALLGWRTKSPDCRVWLLVLFIVLWLLVALHVLAVTW